MSEPAKPTSPEPQVAVTSPEPESTVAAAKAPSPPKSPFDDTEAVVAQQAGSSSNVSDTSPPPVNAETRPSQSPPFQAQDAPTPAGDPRVAGLRAMFPDYDDSILLMVLESVNGNQESAIEALLGMSDPNYKPDAQPVVQAPAQPMSQEELDEQLARRLMIEEQEEQQARWYAHQQRPRPLRQNSQQQEGQTQSPPPGGSTQASDTMAEIQQSLTKAAEVGKKTLGGLFTKVKAKINEFEQGRQSGSPGQQQPQPQWAGGYTDSQQQQYAAASYAQYHHGSASTPGVAPSGAAASYYDPNAASPVIPEQASSPPSRTPPPAVQGYDVSPSAPTPAQVTSSASGGSSVPRPSTSPPPITIDGGKLGLLPKRPVSLVRDSQHASARRSLDSDDGLEYAENPFEDQKK